jgi:hypothetical protein
MAQTGQVVPFGTTGQDSILAPHPAADASAAAKRPAPCMAIHIKNRLQAADDIFATGRIKAVNETPVHLSDEGNVH